MWGRGTRMVVWSNALLYCVYLVSTWWRECWQRAMTKVPSKTLWCQKLNDKWVETSSNPPASWSNNCVYNICNCALSFSYNLTSNKASYLEPLYYFITLLAVVTFITVRSKGECKWPQFEIMHHITEFYTIKKV